MKILFIDDEQDSLKLFEDSFEGDYEVYLANSAEQAKDILNKEEIPVIISDYKMPNINGTELFEQLVRNESQAVRILLTGYTETDIAINAINQGQVFKYVRKPYRRQELKKVIDEAHQVYKLEKDKSNLIHDVLTEQEDKNNRIAEKLYENITQQLIGLKYLYEDETSHELLAEIVKDLCGLSEELMPKILTDLGLIASLKELKYINSSSLRIAPDAPDLSKELEIHLFRVIQYIIHYFKTEKIKEKHLGLDVETNNAILHLTLSNPPETYIHFENKLSFLVQAYQGKLRARKRGGVISYQLSYPIDFEA